MSQYQNRQTQHISEANSMSDNCHVGVNSYENNYYTKPPYYQNITCKTYIPKKLMLLHILKVVSLIQFQRLDCTQLTNEATVIQR